MEQEYSVDRTLQPMSDLTDFLIPLDLTAEMLKIVVANLHSSNDLRRASARYVLVTENPASRLGQDVIEQMAVLAWTHKNDLRLGTQLTWALQEILHDEPSWIAQWIKEAHTAGEITAAQTILGMVHRATSITLDAMLDALPQVTLDVGLALLESMKWLVRLNRLPEECRSHMRELLLGLLNNVGIDQRMRPAIITILGYWWESGTVVGDALLACLDYTVSKSDLSALYIALARLAARETALEEAVQARLSMVFPQIEATSAWVRFCCLREMRREKAKDEPDVRESVPNVVLEQLAESLPDPTARFNALMSAGIDDGLWDNHSYHDRPLEGTLPDSIPFSWNSDYHSTVVSSARNHIEQYPDLLTILLARLQPATQGEDWPTRRMVLAVIAACIEVMPAAFQRAARQHLSLASLEDLLVKCATDPSSHDTRRFALSVLGYTRTLTEPIVSVLLAGCRDTDEVQKGAIQAARHFESVQGNPLPALVAALTGESVSTAYVVALLLKALGASAAGEESDLLNTITLALSNAIKDPLSRREILLPEENLWKMLGKVTLSNYGTLENAFYNALLRIVSWPMNVGREFRSQVTLDNLVSPGRQVVTKVKPVFQLQVVDDIDGTRRIIWPMMVGEFRWLDPIPPSHQVVPDVGHDLTLNLRDAPTYMNRGLAYLSFHEYERAFADFERALAIDPQNALLHSDIGTIYAVLERYEEALAAYEEALRLNPSNAAVWYKKAVTLLNMQRNDDALIAFEEVVGLDPSSVEGWRGKGSALSLLGRHKEALIAYDEVLRLDPADIYAWNGKGYCLQGLERYEAAAEAFRMAAQSDPSRVDIWVNLGATYMQLGQYADALDAYNHILELDASNLDALINKGNVLFELKQFDSAFAAYDQFLALEPQNAGVWEAKGRMLYDLQRYEEALTAFEQALSLDPSNASPWNGKGYACKGLGRYNDALTAIEQAIMLAPDDGNYWDSKGDMYMVMNQPQEAIAAFEHALMLTPTLVGTQDKVTQARRDFETHTEA